MRLALILTLLTCMLPITRAVAQVATEVAPKAEAVQMDLKDVLQGLGMGPEEVAKVQLMAQLAGVDPARLVLLMLLAEEGMGGNGVGGPLLMSQLLSQPGAAQPAAVVAGDKLLVVEDGTVYKISIGDLKVEGTAVYRSPKKAGGVPADLAPLIKQARERAQESSCVSNMKQLCLAALMYAQDNDENLPNEGWAQQLVDYTKNADILRCPAAGDLKVAYALNEALIGKPLAQIADPAKTVLFFESDQGPEVPFGGLDALAAKARHPDGVTLGFADGHVQVVSVEEARKLLGK
jgi:prepilin-type processing-associated H-X9-DG protein